MLDWFRRLLPRNDRFFDLLERHAQLIVEGAEALDRLLEGGSETGVHCRRIVSLEDDADRVAREVLVGLRQTFVTPFDRGDIEELIRAMDDTLDAMQRAAKTITRFEQHEFDADMQAIARIVRAAAGKLADAVPLLRRAVSNADRLARLAEEVVALEGEADLIHDHGLDTLYRASRDPMAYIIGSQILDHLEDVIDRLEDAANQINAIVTESV